MASLFNPNAIPNPSTPTVIKPSISFKPLLRIQSQTPKFFLTPSNSIAIHELPSNKHGIKSSNTTNSTQKLETQLQWPQKIWEFLSNVRQTSPLIQCITNYVSMDIVANTLLSAGALPAMVHAAEEVSDFTPQVHALYINVGTIDGDWVGCMTRAAAIAAQNGKPWVLDPVAAGASGFRLRACLELVRLKPTVIRGNGSEIIALSRAAVGNTKGADSMHDSVDALEAAKSLAQSSNAIVAVSGAVDIITDGQQVIGAYNGVPMMQKVTATGCSVTALIAAFVAADPTHAFEATASALSTFGIAGELGLQMAKGPASLRVNLIDSLYGIDEETILHHAKISWLS